MRTTVEPEVHGNEAFIREVLAFIELHPELWDQALWSGVDPRTQAQTHCFGGWAYRLATGCEHRFYTIDCVDQPTIEDTARRALGITPVQAIDLFGFIKKTVRTPTGGIGLVPVTFADLCEQVELVTGVRFKPPIEVP